MIAIHRPPGTTVPAVVILLTAVAGAALPLGEDSPVRAVAVGLFVFVAPGWIALDAAGLARGALGAALVVAVSTSLVTVVALAQLYAGLWAPAATFVVTAAGTVAAAAVVLWRRLQHAHVEA